MSLKRPRKKVSMVGKARLNIKWPAKLAAFAKIYAQVHNTTVTQIIVDYFTELEKREKKDGYAVEQI